MPVDLGTLTRVDPGQVGAVGGRDRRADRAVALSYTDVVTQTACWEERSQVCDEIRLALAEVRRRTPSAEPAFGPRGTTPRLTVRGTAAGAPPPPPPPPPMHCSTAWGQWAVDLLQHTASLPGGSGQWTSFNALPHCRCGVVWCGVVWCGVAWRGVAWRGVAWRGVVWRGVVWCGVVWCGVVWCGVVWCGVVWCGVVWCVFCRACLFWTVSSLVP